MQNPQRKHVRRDIEHANERDSPVFRKSYELVGIVIEESVRVPRHLRGSLTASIVNGCIRVDEKLVAAAKVRLLERRIDALVEADCALGHVRRMVRRAADSALISWNSYARIIASASEVGRLIGGWLERDEKRLPPDAGATRKPRRKRMPRKRPGEEPCESRKASGEKGGNPIQGSLFSGEV